jgi:hypothetical protein
VANVAVDIHTNASMTLGDLERQKGVAAKLTQFTYVQNTNGVGWRQMGFLFDCTYSSEPVFTYGCQLVSIATAGWLPAGNAIVTHWVQDKAGRYSGVLLVAQVTLAQADGFKYSSKTPAGTAENAKVVVAHNFTFTGPALNRTKAETTLAIDTLKGLATGIT